jgi:hypothetical protein
MLHTDGKQKKSRTSKVGEHQKERNNNHSQSIGWECVDQCGFQSDFLVSVMVKRELTKL